MVEQVKGAVEALNSKEILLYPTDTVWGIGCDATDERTVAKVFEIKQRSESKSLIILVDGFEMLAKYIPNVPKIIKTILLGADNPTTVIYSNPVGLAKNCIASDATVAIRIPDDEFCISLIKEFGKPIVSTSANISGYDTPSEFKEIDKRVLEEVDYIVDLHKDQVCHTPSTIIKVEGEQVIYLRR